MSKDTDFIEFVRKSKIGFIGGGNMAFSIALGLLDKGTIQPDQIIVSGPHLSNLEKWKNLDERVTITEDNRKTVSNAQIIFICVKPNMLNSLTGLKDLITPEKLFISVLAGIKRSTFAQTEFQAARLVRAMPNICVQVGEGSIVVAQSQPAADPELVKWLFSQIGTAEIVPEEKLDSFTGLSGSGPAYVFTVIDALADGAVKMGVPRDLALKFAAQTVCGAAKTALVTGKHPAVLKDEVCSPGGTTIHGVHELEKGNLRATLINAVEAATKRAQELQPKK